MHGICELLQKKSCTQTARPSVSVTHKQSPVGPHAGLLMLVNVPHVVPGWLHSSGVTVTVDTTVTTGVGAVVTTGVMPQQEQADLYRTAPEQALAYEGIEVGTTVTWRASRPTSSRLCGGVTVTVVKIVLVLFRRLV